MPNVNRASLQLTSSSVGAAVAEAMALIRSGEIEAAGALSAALTAWIAGYEPDLRLRSDGRDRPYSIMVVAYEADDLHADLVGMLLSLDPDRFQIILIENTDYPLFKVAEAETRRNVDLVRLGCNTGLGVARNIALKIATGVGLLFIDDDGFTTPADIEALIEAFEGFEAVSVRGKVQNRSESAVVPQHYDIGSVLIPRFSDAEGFTIWRCAELTRVGGFDPILYGHEGKELTARLYRSLGHEAFLYEPKAVLLHDYASDEARHAEKQARYLAINKYCIARDPGFLMLMPRFFAGRQDPEMMAALHLRRRLVSAARTAAPGSALFIIAVHRGVPDALARFVDDLNRQEIAGLHLILVDESGGDEVAVLLDRQLDSGITRQVLQSDRTQRGTALNAALDIARRHPHALCMFADVGEGMIVQRARWTRAAHALFPDRSFIAFAPFRLNRPLAIDGPIPSPGASFAALLLFGSRIPWSTLSFRPADLNQRFDEAPGARIVEDWLERCLAQDRTGAYLPLGVAFQSEPPDEDRDGRQQATIRRQAALLGSEAAVDGAALRQLAGWEVAGDQNAARSTADYAWRLYEGMDGYGEEAPAVRAELRRRLAYLDARQLADERRRLSQLSLDLETARAESTEWLLDLRQAYDEAAQLRIEFQNATAKMAQIRAQAERASEDAPGSSALVTSMAGIVAAHLEIRQEIAQLRHRLLAGAMRERELTEREAQLRTDLSVMNDREKEWEERERRLNAALSEALAREPANAER